MSEREVTIVTGAASGIGRAIATRLAQDGFHVVCLDRSADQLHTVVESLRSAGLTAEGHPVDVTDEDALRALYGKLQRIDVVVTAAGIYQDAALIDLKSDDFRRMFEVNVMGTFIPAQLALTRMKRGGRIVTISSRGALGGTRFAHYVASKAAVIGLTRAMAMDLRPEGIAVNSVAPGFTDTPMTRSAPDEMQEAWNSIETTGKAADPSEIAHSVAFLCNPRTTFITGQTLFVDGGKSLGGLGI